MNRFDRKGSGGKWPAPLSESGELSVEMRVLFRDPGNVSCTFAVWFSRGSSVPPESPQTLW